MSYFISNKPVLAIVWTEYYPLSRILYLYVIYLILIISFVRGYFEGNNYIREEGIYGKSILVKKIKKEKNLMNIINFKIL